MDKGERLRFAALGGGLRASFDNLHAAYSSTDSETDFTAAECAALPRAEGDVLGVILAARGRGMVT
jgi:hypothetical protein